MKINRATTERRMTSQTPYLPLPRFMRGGSFPQESIFPTLAAKLDKFTFTRVYHQIHAEINTLESDRHETIGCIARVNIGNRASFLH